MMNPATGIPSDRDAALTDEAGRKLATLGDGTAPVRARFGAASLQAWIPNVLQRCDGLASLRTEWSRDVGCAGVLVRTFL